MSPVPPPQRVRDIPADHAEGLRRVHKLTAESAKLHRALETAVAVADPLDLVRQVDAADRERALLEINLRSRRIPAVWIDVARRLGAAHQPWTTDQILPPARTDTRRSSRNRVAADTHLLVDMAAVSVLRDHLLNHHRHPIDPTTTDAVQFRRNMGAIWQRSIITARLINLRDDQRTRVTAAAAADLTQRIGVYREMSLDDIHTLWHAYTGGGLADTYRRSITATPGPGRSTNPPLPDPQHWLDQARTNLTAGGPPQHNRDIERAVAAAIPAHILGKDADHHHGHGLDQMPGANAVIEPGPDP